MKRGLFLVFALAVAAGCGDDDGGSDVAPDCNPLGGGSCVLPFPSSVFMKVDTTSPTGMRVDLGAASLPANIDGVRVKPDYYNKRDGFSTDAPVLVSFPNSVEPGNLPSHTNPAASTEATSPTMIVDMTTNERVLHFAEVDIAAADTPAKQALILWPLVRLKGGHRYAVGIRKTLKAKGGGELPISAGFQAMLDGKPSGHARLDATLTRYPEIFAALTAAGMPKTDLVLAWDFVTASDASIQADLLDARDLALAQMGDKGANLTFQVDTARVAADVDPLITKKIIYGTYDVPLLLTEDGGRDSVLARDDAGKPKIVGTYHSPFGVVIPACADTQKPLPILIYGHGLLGSYSEAVDASYVRKVAQFLCVAVIATDWRGMSSRDIATVGFALNDVNLMNRVFEQLVQGIVNFIALEQISRGPMAASDTFKDGGQPLLDPTRVYYYGISQGGIYGATFMAHDPHIVRGALAVGGVNYSLLIQRSSDWPQYGGILAGAYHDVLDQQVLIHLMQMVWDPVDPVTTAAHLIGKVPPLRGTPQKQILMQIAVGDSQVPNLGSELQARIMGQPVLGPSVYPTHLLEVKTGPLPSAMTFFDEKKEPVPPITNASLPDNGTHGSVRKLRATNEQLKHFFETGEIIQTCKKNGVEVACDCTDPDICGPQI